MTVALLECPKCHGRFNYEWSLSGSLGPIRFGLDRSMFKCAICKELNSFDVSYRGRDPALPTYNDMQVGVGGKLLGEFFGPLFVLLAVGIVLLAVTPYRLPGMVAVLAGFSWLAGFAYRLDRRLGASVRPRPPGLGGGSGARPRPAGDHLGLAVGLGIVLMSVGGGLGAMSYYSYYPPGANRGTGNPSVDLAIDLIFFLGGLVLVAVSVLQRRGSKRRA